MARPNDYSRKRYIIMQSMMWVILAATVGVAALTSRYRATTINRIDLGEPMPLQTVEIRLPDGWRTVEIGEGEIRSLEPTRPPAPQRILSVTERNPNDVGFLERWMSSGGPPRAGARTPRRADRIVPMGPMDGVLAINRVPVDEEYGIDRVTYTITGTLESGNVVTISMAGYDTTGQDNPRDVAIMKGVAASVKPLNLTGPQLRGR